MDYRIEEMLPQHWNQVASIYLEGINTGKATFQSEVPTFETWNNGHVNTCRFVAIFDNKVAGWAALSPTSSRCVYSGVAEVSVYIGENYRGLGIGSRLLNELVKASEENGFWSLRSGIISENTPSIKLHKRCGFREVGITEKVAKMKSGIWHDVIIMERRSKIVGID